MNVTQNDPGSADEHVLRPTRQGVNMTVPSGEFISRERHPGFIVSPTPAEGHMPAVQGVPASSQRRSGFTWAFARQTGRFGRASYDVRLPHAQ